MPSTLLLAAAAVAACAGPPEPRTTAGLAAAEAAWVAALEASDTAALACRLDPGFADNTWRGGVRTRAEVLAALPSRPAGRIELKDLDTRVEGAMGVVRGVSVGHDANDAVTTRARFTDVFVWRDGRWRAVAAQETPILD